MSETIDTNSLPAIGEDSKLGGLVSKFAAEYSQDPKEATSAGLLGWMYSHYGEFDAAARVFNFGVDTFPSDHKIIIRRAEFLSRCPDQAFRNGSAAIKDAKHALELARHDGWFDGRPYEECDYLETLAAGYALLGDTASAISTLWDAHSIARTNKIRKRLIESLAQVEAGKILVHSIWERAGRS